MNPEPARTSQNPPSGRPSEQSPMERIADAISPGREILSMSHPQPRLRSHNVIAVLPSTDDARDAIVSIEQLGLVGADSRIGLVVTGAEVPNGLSVDPEGVARQNLPRVVMGALVGGVLGAGVGAAGAALGSLAIVLGVLCGAALGGVLGGVWAAFAGFGGSDAYRQSFVPPHVLDRSVVSFHTDDADEAAAVSRRLAALAPARPLVFDEHLGPMEDA